MIRVTFDGEGCRIWSDEWNYVLLHRDEIEKEIRAVISRFLPGGK